MDLKRRLLLTIVRYRYVFIAFLLFNLCLSAYIISVKTSGNSYKSRVKIVFNQVSKTFSDNHSTEYLFGGNAILFANILSMDTLMRNVAEEFDLVSHYGIQGEMHGKSPLEQAQERLRHSIEIENRESGIVIIHSDKDALKAKKVLDYLVANVKGIHYSIIDQNNSVTRELATRRLLQLESTLDILDNQILSRLEELSDSSVVNSQKLSEYTGSLIARKLEIESVHSSLDLMQSSPKYQPYFIIHEGVKEDSANWVSVFIMALLGNILVFFAEINITLLFVLLREKYIELTDL